MKYIVNTLEIKISGNKSKRLSNIDCCFCCFLVFCFVLFFYFCFFLFFVFVFGFFFFFFCMSRCFGWWFITVWEEKRSQSVSEGRWGKTKKKKHTHNLHNPLRSCNSRSSWKDGISRGKKILDSCVRTQLVNVCGANEPSHTHTKTHLPLMRWTSFFTLLVHIFEHWLRVWNVYNN